MNWKDIVKSVAPVIGGSFGGPFGAAATKFLAGKLLGDEGKENELEQFIATANPEQLAQLRSIDNEFKVKMAELGFKEEELHQHDRASARELAKVNMWPQIVISVLYNVCYFYIMSFVVSHAIRGDMNIPENAHLLIGSLLGVMTVELPRINAFWFGTSSGSKEKTAQLAK